MQPSLRLVQVCANLNCSRLFPHIHANEQFVPHTFSARVHAQSSFRSQFTDIRARHSPLNCLPYHHLVMLSQIETSTHLPEPYPTFCYFSHWWNNAATSPISIKVLDKMDDYAYQQSSSSLLVIIAQLASRRFCDLTDSCLVSREFLPISSVRKLLFFLLLSSSGGSTHLFSGRSDSTAECQRNEQTQLQIQGQYGRGIILAFDALLFAPFMIQS